MRRVAVVTGARADFGLYRPILRAIDATEGLEYRLLVCGAHLADAFGRTVDEIEAEGFAVARRIEGFAGADAPREIAETMARTMTGFADAFAAERPDVVLVLGDRYEMFAAAAAATVFALPIAHIHGGELSEGVIDDAFRHSITKMSHIHFVSTGDHARRVIQLGEQPDRVHVTGAPGLDNVAALDLADRAELERDLGMTLDPSPVLATFHPPTLEPGAAVAQLDELLAALAVLNRPIVLTYPNADAEGARIAARIDAFVAEHPRATAAASLGTRRYFGLMRIACAMVGNSSSGIIEAASFALPVVNVGDRQRGRTKGANVIDAAPERRAIGEALARAADPAFRASLAGLRNPYGDGHAAERIAAILKDALIGPEILKKTFHDIPSGNASAVPNPIRNKAYG